MYCIAASKNDLIKKKQGVLIFSFLHLEGLGTSNISLLYVPVNSKTAHPPPPPRAIPGHLTPVKLRKVGNLTQNEARPVGHLTFVSKRLSAVGGKRISQFFGTWAAFTGHCSCRFHVGFFCCCRFILLYRGIFLCLKCGAKTSWPRNS